MTIADCGLGKVKATYDQTLQWDYLRVPVKNWIPRFSTLNIKFKSYSASNSGPIEFIGLSVNSNDVLVELKDSPVKNLPYNDETGEYTLSVNVGDKKRISSLNFYFDAKSKFNGTRTVEFTSIDFVESTGIYISNFTQPFGTSYVISKNDNGTNIKWGGDASTKLAYDYLNVKVNNYDPEFGDTVKVTLTSTSKDSTIGIWRRMDGKPDTDFTTYFHAPIGKANEEVVLDIPLILKEGEKNLPSSFELLFYFDGGKAATAGEVTIKSLQIFTLPKVPTLINITQNSDNCFEINQIDKIISWGENKSQWSHFDLHFANVDKSIKSIKFTIACTDAETQLGIHCPATGAYLLPNGSVLGSEKIVEITVPPSETTDLVLHCYINVNNYATHKTQGKLTIKNIEYVK